MAKVVCPKCENQFDGNDNTHRVTRGAAAGVLGTAGAVVGSGIGVVTAGTGMAATIPLAVGGAVIGYLGASSFRRCPSCGKIFKI